MAESHPRVSALRIIHLYGDLAACVAFVAFSVVAYLALPEGAQLRLVLAAPILLFVPGYLLVESFRSSRRPFGRRTLSAIVAPGATIAVVGVLALATAFLPGGIRPNSIVAMITLACLGLVGAAGYHRTRIVLQESSGAVPQPSRFEPRPENINPQRAPPSPPQTTSTPTTMQAPPRPIGVPQTTVGSTEHPPTSQPQRSPPRIIQTGRL